MKNEAKNHNFEKAIKIRNKINAFQYIKDINFNSLKNGGIINHINYE